MDGGARVLAQWGYTTATNAKGEAFLKAAAAEPVPNVYSSPSSPHTQHLQQINLDSRKMYAVALTRDRFL